MFGYQEPKYSVIKKVEVETENGKKIFEIRSEKILNEKYISYVKYNKKNVMIIDLLFLYKENSLSTFRDEKSIKNFLKQYKTKLGNIKKDKKISKDLKEDNKTPKELTKDWNKLINSKNDKSVDTKEFSALEVIQDHHIGYLKSGAIIMY